jgi:hypothetical protein
VTSSHVSIALFLTGFLSSLADNITTSALESVQNAAGLYFPHVKDEMWVSFGTFLF